MNLEKFLPSFLPSKRKEFKMIWKIEKHGVEGYLAGSAHFFLYPFKKSLSSYIGRVRRVLFEGPLDEKSMGRVVTRGVEKGGAEAIYAALDPQTIGRIRKIIAPLRSSSPSFPDFLTIKPFSQDPLFIWFKTLRPWLAFFQIWSQFLKNNGWKYSVDLEALKIATQLKKEIFFLETIEEQVAALEGVPLERIINYLKQIEHWEDYARNHAHYYLQGDLEQIMVLNREFPTRCPSIVDNRDPVMFERIKAFLAKGEVIAFVGTSHIQGITKFLQEDGYAVRKYMEK